MYILSTQQLLDLFSRNPDRAISGWLRENSVGENDLFASVISFGIIAHLIEGLPAGERSHWRRLLAEGRRELEHRGRVIEVSMDIVEAWAANLRGAAITSASGAAMGEDERLVIATAVARRYTLVARLTASLDDLMKSTVLTVVDPDA